jgi:ribosomal protein L11 methyltransferase
MEYYQISIASSEQGQKDLLIALLGEEGYEGFEERDDRLIAFIPAADYNEQLLSDILLPLELEFSKEQIAQQNWNASWEANFEPVIIDSFCTIKAHFHDIEVNTPYKIVITPKMSFGTGHHATTRLMMQQMAGIDFKDRKVLDFGTGTGVLAILSEMLGAADVLAVDNDNWAYENTRENIEANSCSRIDVKQGSLDAAGDCYDIILANINRHILLEYMADMWTRLKPEGKVLMSGILNEDKDMIIKAAKGVEFNLVTETGDKGWISLLFSK